MLRLRELCARLDETADNYDADATQAGTCYFDGCTIAGACNYDSSANNNDGSCAFVSCIGCQTEGACNYDEAALYPGACTFPATGFDCDGNCLDSDADEVCDNDEIEGCTDEDALNYEADATDRRRFLHRGRSWLHQLCEVQLRHGSQHRRWLHGVRLLCRLLVHRGMQLQR